MAEKKKAEAVEAEAVEKKAVDTAKQDVDKWIARKMKAINEMTSPAKARQAALRVLQNKRKVGK